MYFYSDVINRKISEGEGERKYQNYSMDLYQYSISKWKFLTALFLVHFHSQP